MGQTNSWPYISGTVDPAYAASVAAALATKADAAAEVVRDEKELDIADAAAGAAALRFLGVEEGWAIDGFADSGGVSDLSNALRGLGRVPAVTTVERSTTATYTGRNGLMQTAAINALRLGYDPVGYRPTGIRIGPGTVNLFTYSNDFSHEIWSKTRCTVSANLEPSPDGSTSGDRIVADGAGDNTRYIYQNFTAAASTAYTASYHIKKTAANAPGIQIYSGFQGVAVLALFNPATGTAAVVTGVGAAGMEHAPNGMWRCWMTATSQASPTSAAVAFQMTNSYTPAVGDLTVPGDSVFANPISCAQFEASAFLGPYVETTSASVSTTADNLKITLSSVPGFSVATGFSVVVEFSLVNLRLSQTILTIHDGTASNNYINLIMGAVTASTLFSSSASGGVYGGATALATGLTVSTTCRVAFSVAGGVMRASVNGGAIVTRTFTAPVGLTTVTHGNRHGGGYSLDGHLRRAKIISRLLSDADLQTESTAPANL